MAAAARHPSTQTLHDTCPATLVAMRRLNSASNGHNPVRRDAVISEPQSRRGAELLPQSPMRLLVTGGTGVLGRALKPLAEAAGHELSTPGHVELDLFDACAVADAVR